MTLLFFTILLMFKIIEINCHGRLIDPPARSSAWREDPVRFPYVYYDNQMFCGGFDTQYKKNKGKCGICGEDWSKPRLFEKGGELYRGFTVRTYRQGSRIQVEAELTANHEGFMEYRICSVDESKSGEANQLCLNKNILKDSSGRTRIAVNPKMIGVIKTTLVLPKDLSCEHCVLQWRYHAGNSWNTDPITKQGCKGCGPQEEFYGCADVKVVKTESTREETDAETEESKYLLIQLLEQLKALKEKEQANNNNNNNNDEIIADLEILRPARKEEVFVFPNDPIASEEYEKSIVYPDEPRPSEEIFSRDVYSVGKPRYFMNTIVNPDEARPSEELYGREIYSVGEPRYVANSIVYPDEPRPSEEYGRVL